MRRKLKYFGMPLLLFALILTGCSNDGAETAGTEEGSDKIHVVTTIAQIAEPLSVIGGEHVKTESLMGPGVDPHLYKATQGDIKKLGNSDIIFYNGLNLEGNMGEVFKNLQKSKPVHALAEAVPEKKLLYDEDGAVDPHVWFDIELWKIALEEAVEVLKEYAPEHADDFEQNKESYFAELDELHKEAKEQLMAIPEEKRVLVTAHDAFGYFGNAYDMEVVGLQGLSTEDEIGISDIDDTIALLLEYQIPAVFVESSVNQSSIKAVIEGAKEQGLDVKLGGELFSDAMGSANTEEGTYIGMYRYNVKTIYEALQGVEE